MAMLPPVLDVKNDGAGLVIEPEVFLGARDEVEILIAGQVVFRLVGVDGQAIQVFLAARCARHRPRLGEGTVQILGDEAAHVGHFNAVVVVCVQKMGGKVLAAAPPVALRSAATCAIEVGLEVLCDCTLHIAAISGFGPAQ